MIRAGLRPDAWLLLLCLLLAAPAAAPASERASGAILGRVIAARDGRAIAGATVTARSLDAPGAPQALTAADGVFFLTGLAPGRYTVTASFGGFESISVTEHPIRTGAPPTSEALHFALQHTGDALSPLAAERTVKPPPGAGVPTRPRPRQRTRGPTDRLRHAPSHMEARVRWEAPPPGEAAPRPARAGERFVVLELYRYSGAMPRQRAPELTEQQILVVGVDAGGEPRDWALLPDPTLARAEGPDPAGRLEGETLRLAEAEFLVTLSADPAIVALRVYRPRDVDGAFTLEFLGEAELLRRLVEKAR